MPLLDRINALQGDDLGTVEQRKLCRVWYCMEKPVSSDGLCAQHKRQFDRTGSPLAGKDARVLNRMCVRSVRILRDVMPVLIWIDQNDIAHCRVCDSHSAPHGKIEHKPGCAARAAKELLLSD